MAQALTDGRGVDHVIEVGGPATMAQSSATCRAGGPNAVVGVLTGFTGEASIPALFTKRIRLNGILLGSRADHENMIRAIEVNRIKSVVDRRFRRPGRARALVEGPS